MGVREGCLIFLLVAPTGDLCGEIISCMSVCEICPANRWYQTQDQIGMNYETIRDCWVGGCRNGFGLDKNRVILLGETSGEIISCVCLCHMPGQTHRYNRTKHKGVAMWVE